MNKKIYQAPLMTIVKVETVNMIAGSPGGGYDPSTSASGGAAMGREGGWFDED